ncbi:MAG: DUF5655 domain-containing protein [Acidobacteriota bacterium]
MTRKPSLYSVHPSVVTARAVIDNLPAKTGRSLEGWIQLLRRDGPSDTAARRAWLKDVCKLGGTTAWMIVDRAEGRGAEDTDPKAYLAAAAGYVEAMYSGPRAGLRPMHDALLKGVRARHADVKVCPCQTIVPLYRTHVIAQIKPATKTRLDFGLALKGARGKLPRRLVPTGGLEKGDRITHRIELTSPQQIDDELWKWFEVAHDLDG